MLNIFEDSLAIISWAKGDHRLSSVQLNGWLNRVLTLISWFADVNFCYIYREYNVEADKLSKLARADMDDTILVKDFWDGSLKEMYSLAYV